MLEILHEEVETEKPLPKGTMTYTQQYNNIVHNKQNIVSRMIH